MLYIEFEVNDVTILYDVIFSFETDSAGCLEGLFIAVPFQLVKSERFRPYEATFHVTVHFACRVESGGPLLYRPGA